MTSALAGKRILVTRPAEQAGPICQLFTDKGATIIAFPTIRIEPRLHPEQLQDALSQLTLFDRAIFTSVNGVVHTWRHLHHPWPKSVPVAAIGPATASALRERGVTPDFVPSEYVAEALAHGLGSVRGQTILLPRAFGARPVLVDLLRAAGARVVAVTAYETRVNHPPGAAFAALATGADIVTFTSGSTVDGFVAVTSGLRIHLNAACIGPVTAQIAAEAGFTVSVVAKTYTTEGLVIALEEYFEELEHT